MLTIEKKVTVAAAPDRVFQYVDDVHHLPEFWPSMVEVKDVRPLPVGGHRFQYLYKMAGVRFEGHTETIDRVEDRKLVDRASGDIDATFEWEFTPHDGVTEVDLKVQYEPPKTLLGKIGEPLVRTLNEREAETVLANLKSMIEG
jgi:ribosome-associated toxin RatA of RatAB toxin-antitoxin module